MDRSIGGRERDGGHAGGGHAGGGHADVETGRLHSDSDQSIIINNEKCE